MRPGRDFISPSREISTHVLMHDSSCRTRYRFYIGERERERESARTGNLPDISLFMRASKCIRALFSRRNAREYFFDLFYPLMGNEEGREEGWNDWINYWFTKSRNISFGRWFKSVNWFQWSIEFGKNLLLVCWFFTLYLLEKNNVITWIKCLKEKLLVSFNSSFSEIGKCLRGR